ncbi:MAG: tetratricopeptide repeat protein [bacterium]|nr:tetratricopeptide repeat protein [bacterium]
MILPKSGKTSDIMFEVYYQSYNFKESCMDYHEPGWVKKEDIELSMEAVFIEAAKFYQGAERSTATGCHTLSLSKAQAVLKRTLRYYPSVYFVDRSSIAIHSGVKSLTRRAFLHTEQGNFLRAQQLLNKLIREYPQVYSNGRRTGSYAYIYKANIYWEYMNQPGKALKCLHKVIKHFSRERVWSHEHGWTCGIDALYDIPRLAEKCKLSPTRQLKEYRRVIRFSNDVNIKMAAIQLLAEVLRSQKKFKQAVLQLKKFILKYPCVLHYGWAFQGNRSMDALYMMVRILIEDLDDPGEVIRICEKIQAKTCTGKCGDLPDLFRVALFYKNVILDYTSGSRNVVAANYRLTFYPFTVPDIEKGLTAEIVRSRNRSDLWDWSLPPFRGMESHGVFMSGALRLEEIENHTPEKKKAVETLTVYKYPDRKSRVLKKIPPGTAYSTCYPLLLTRYSGRTRWLKIEISGGGMGWILQEEK